MSDPLDQSARLLSRYDGELAQLIPQGAEIFDAHVHCGHDIDGFVAGYDDLVAFLRRSGAYRAFCFCLDEPDRHPAFRAANDRTLAAAERSEGLLVPFVRLDLAEEPLHEATRVLDLGAQGIKLHPRSQGFVLDDGRLEPIFALAAERRVPILIHGGRGLPPIAGHLRGLVDRHPESQLIIAHGGIADLGALADAFAEHPGVFFDTSIWSAVDILDLFCRVSPEQLLYASDFPYGQHPQALLLDLRIAQLAGYSAGEVRGILGLNAARIAAGVAAPPPSPPKLGTRTLVQPIQLTRIHTYLTMATSLLWSRHADATAAVGLAVNAAGERDGHADVCDRIIELLTCAQDVFSLLPALDEESDRISVTRNAFRLIHLADIEALTARS